MRLFWLIVALRALRLSRLLAEAGVGLIHTSTRLAIYAKSIIDEQPETGCQ